eukprot:TRINITY_DN5729_c0_g1_i1.p1 TRINITY_DN5729_c0_g1~~TRINITY_DN5729_c0_g1_i1.p1  ORF type:complete len:1828 (-),score=246.14 TRINITY_DN5729_c0_g1_i1:262-5436(-)
MPPVETDLSSGAYLRSDGVVSDRYDSMIAATDYEQRRASESDPGIGGRRLKELAANFHQDGSAPPYDSGLDSLQNESLGRQLQGQQAQQFYAEWALMVYYEATGDHIFTDEAIRDIRALEQKIVNLPGWKKFCLVSVRGSSNCRMPISAMRFFYGSTIRPENRGTELTINPDGLGSEMHSVPMVMSAMSEPTKWRQLTGVNGRLWYFDHNFPKSKHMRSKFWFGTPFEGYSTRVDRREEQVGKFSDFVNKELYPVLKDASTANIKVYYQGGTLEGVQVVEAVTTDALLALLSLVLVYTYMSSYTKAPLLAMFGMMTVLLGIPVGTVLFVMFGHVEFPIINLLCLFLLTGIGADHLFILTDAWEQSKAVHDRSDTYKRLDLTMQRAGKAIVACGTTTAISFFANLWSSIRPLRMFGEYVGMCIVANFVLCLGVFPLVLILREPKNSKEAPGAAPPTGDPSADPDNPVIVASAQDGSEAQQGDPTAQGTDDRNAEPVYQGRIERFMAVRFAAFLHRFRWALVGLGLLVTLLCLILAANNLRVTRDPPVFFAAGSHNLADVMIVRQKYGNMARWAADMETLPIHKCRGCRWTGGNLDLVPVGCLRLGPTCEARPCAGDPLVADVDPCAGKGNCNANTGTCDCVKGLTGPDCRLNSGESDQDCKRGTNNEVCSGNGICNRASCWCNFGWKGEICDKQDFSVQSIDCKWAPWLAWSACTATCGWGQYFRNRVVREAEKDGGKPCVGRTLQTSGCNMKDCDVDCSWSDWNTWGQCSTDCGEGHQTRTRTVATQARGMGASCQGADQDIQVCNQAACPSQCDISDWQEGTCSATCGTDGKMKRTRTVTVVAGAAPGSCPIGDTEEFVPCNIKPCPDVCEYGPWKNEGDCSASCGEGRVRQVRDILRGSGCASETSAERLRVETCVVTCAVTCEDANFGLWTSWGSCSAECGPSQRTRTRTTTDPACDKPENLEEVVSCNKPNCPRTCSQYVWEAAGPCSVSCGQGKRVERRNFQGDTPPSDCPAQREVDCVAGIECPVDCILSSNWEAVSQCSASCGQGRIREEKPVVQHGAYGGTQCPPRSSTDRTRYTSCEMSACAPPTPSPTPTPIPTPVPIPIPTPIPTPSLTPVPWVPVPIPSPTPVPIPVPTPSPRSEVPDFHLDLTGHASMTPQEEANLANLIAAYLKISSDRVQLKATASGGRRLQSSTLEVAVLVDGTPTNIGLSTLQAAIDSNQMVTSLKSTGFSSLTSISYRPAGSLPGPTSAPEQSFKASSEKKEGDLYISEEMRNMPANEVGVVSLVFGLLETPPPLTRGLERGKPLLDKNFDFSRASVQEAVAKACAEAEALGDKLGVRRGRCFTTDFAIWLKTQGKTGYPSPGPEIHGLLAKFMQLRLTMDYDLTVGLSDDGSRVLWVQLLFETNLPHKLPAQEAWKWSEQWDNFVEDFNRREAGPSLGKVFHTCDIWVRAETEVTLVRSTLMCAVFSFCCAFLAVILFLRNLALGVYLILSIICVVVCLAALMFGIIGWPFGAVEAIGLIVFVGFSVDYSMHLAEAFRQSQGATRFEKMRDGLQRTGGAIFSSACTSLMAGLPLLFCTIQVFVKFGITVVSNTVLSLAFSLFFFAALLMAAGPIEDPCITIFGSLLGRKQPAQDRDLVVGTVLDPPVEPKDAGYHWSTGEPSGSDPKKGGDDSSPRKGGDQETDPQNPEVAAFNVCIASLWLARAMEGGSRRSGQ